ncbi:MAG: Hsp70 family protein [Planctomyces sp.]|nr:Hsp70 family protein [Planctomyces sp.]
MKKTQAVGIDLGTTYSCIAWLNEHGQPVTIPNQEGELATPSTVFFDDDHYVVGTEALRNSISHPDRVVMHAKRFMGDSQKFWKIGNARYSPVHISGMILRKLIAAAQERIGPIEEAVITVPAQFSDAQRHATLLAGHSAGLDRIEMINEPVAAALCHVLGNEGLAFRELAIDQTLLVYDLGGGTLDLAVVRYTNDEVRVIASDGDLQLGGLDWTRVLVDAAAEKFIADFGDDPRTDPESHQSLFLEAEQAKRSLSVRPRAAINVVHGGRRRSYQIELQEFEHLSRNLLARCESVTRRILKDNRMGWAHIDVVLTTGGASRMPMVKESLKKLSGRTLNTSLSPDQSIAHGAAYYAGMLLSDRDVTRTIFSSQASARLAKVRQQSVCARSLGILIRDEESGKRIPHYLIPANSSLPVACTHVFGTVVANQTRVHVRIVESGAGADLPPTVLGDCVITELPKNLPEGSEVEVTISYDHLARVHVSARELKSGIAAETEIIRQENISAQLEQSSANDVEFDYVQPVEPPTVVAVKPTQLTEPNGHPVTSPQSTDDADPLSTLAKYMDEFDFEQVAEDADIPILLCDQCGKPLGNRGECPRCLPQSKNARRPAKPPQQATRKTRTPEKPGITGTHGKPAAGGKPTAGGKPPMGGKTGGKARPGSSERPKNNKPQKPPRKSEDPEAEEFWDLVDGNE